MSRLFSYVVQHDYGYAPNPEDGFCTLAKCKYGRGGRKNIIELAGIGDWIAGTGGADLRVSAGHGKLVYAMRVEEKLRLREYHQDPRFRGRRDNEARDAHLQDRYALIFSFFYYFGRNAPDLSGLPEGNLHHPFEKRGPGHRSDFTEGVHPRLRQLAAASAGSRARHQSEAHPLRRGVCDRRRTRLCCASTSSLMGLHMSQFVEEERCLLTGEAGS